ncbi:hypothetical protein CC1G_11323 [Coprinopsis cinerea okayama7|uniref:Uncharacterized protein n=1 Tax=Coprinopsis cinerea (strain Okayama-7 / 130 / ATCC MYA-4618 / FGSC 9003) TaxID=240176 RepID=A8P5Q5_COPC7|nr:hypothetical protein CC1G_11323 [Coprinopsis cinerea okayama7\|eukprot:XP_001839000.1 hypothetical protein CC1G_11323 [Coprinopsis cinerea okayama7\
MDFLKKKVMNEALKVATGKDNKQSSSSSTVPGQPKKEDHLDKAIDLVQEHIFKQGSQKNESAAEQAKDEKIKKGITTMYKMATGKKFPGTK